MANTKISDMTTIGTLADGDLIPVVDIDVAEALQNKKFTITQLRALIQDEIANGIPQIYTENGSVSVDTGVPQTIKTMTASDVGLWTIFTYFDDGTIGGAARMFFVRESDYNNISVSTSTSGTIDVPISTTSVQVTQTSGVTKTLQWSLTKLSITV